MSATVLYDPGEARPARLFVWDASRALRTVPVESGMTLGRAGPDSTADLPLQSSIVSRRHGEILQLDDGYCYRDLGSLNGTHVNGVLYGSGGGMGHGGMSGGNRANRSETVQEPAASA